MVETPGIISNTIVVNATQAKQEFETLSRQLREIKAAHEKALSSKSNTTLFKGEQQSAEALQRQIVLLTDSLYKLRNLQNVGISSTNERINVAADKKYYEDQNKAIKANSDAIKEQMKTNVAYDKYMTSLASKYNRQDARTDARESQIWAQYARSSQSAKPQDYQGYAKQIQVARLEAERLHQVMLKNNTEQTRLDFANARAGLQGAVKASDEFSRSLGIASDKAGYLGSLGQKIRSHFNWILAGSLLAAFAVIPTSIENIARETEVLGQKLKQNLELAERYRDNHHGLEGDIKHLGEVAQTFAVGYGANVHDVMEMMQVLSRRFKSPEELTYYTNLAMIMHKLDFVAPKKAAEDLEAVILSMGLDFRGAKKFIDEFSVAVHTARITGTELLSGLQRSGATMHNMNLNTAESIALISTLSTVTAKAGSNIGNSLNSILINVDFKKAASALKAYNIEVYDAMNNNEMRKGVEIWREIAQVFNGLDDKHANEFANAMSGGKFRANDLRALLGNWHEFEAILKNINEKASPELTASLLKTGMETYDTNVKRMNASLQVFGIIIGNEVLPSLKNMTNGLSEGVQWLNKHRDEVALVVKGIGYFIEALVLYRIQQLLANSTLGAFVGTTKLLVSNAPGFIGSVKSMGSAMYGFGITIASAVARMAAFMVMAESINRIGSGWSQDSAEKQFDRNIAGAGSRDAGAGRELTKEEQDVIAARAARDKYAEEHRSNGIIDHITGAVGGVFFNTKEEQSEYDRLNNIAKQKLQIVESSSKMNDITKMVAEAEKGIAVGPPKVDYDKVAGQDIGSGGSKDSYSLPNDPSRKIQRDAYNDALVLAMHRAKIAADEYSASLDNLNTKEEINGKTTATAVERLNLMQSRWQTLNDQEWTSNNIAEALNTILDSKMSDDIIPGISIEAWRAKTKAQKAELKAQYKDILDNHNDIKELMATIDKAEENASKNRLEKTKIGNDITKLSSKVKPEEYYKDSIARNNVAQDILIAQSTNKLDPNNEVTLNAIRLHKLLEDKKFHNAEKIRLDKVVVDAEKSLRIAETENARQAAQNQLDIARDAANKQRLIVEQNAQAIKDAEYAKNSKIKEGLAGITQDIIVQGSSLKSVWSNLWSQLANDAIKALFRVQNSSGGLLSSIIGLFGGGGTVSPTARLGSNVRANTTAAVMPSIAFADGGIVDKPVYGVFGEAGEEANINLAKLSKGDNRQRGLLAYANAKSGTHVTANVSQRTMDIATQASAEAKANREHINELQRANTLMQEQNRMILYMINNGGQSNTTVAQPIIAKQDMSIEDFVGMVGKAKSLGYTF